MKADQPIVSVVVPTRNSAATLRACLDSIAVQTYPHIELIVADRFSNDETQQIARTCGARLLTAEPERAAQRNAGARAAKGDLVLFVDSDMVLEPGVVAVCVAARRRRGDTAAVVVPERGFPDRFFTRIRSLEKLSYVGNSAVEAARFFPREQFLALGGYNEALSSAEDWDLTDRWCAAGGTLIRADAFIIHDDRALTARELVRKRFAYGRAFLAYARGNGRVAARHLGSGRYLPLLRLALLHPLEAFGLIGLKILEVVSFSLGLATGWLGSAITVRRPVKAPRAQPQEPLSTSHHPPHSHV